MRTAPEKIRASELAKIHIAKEKLGLDDETYRDMVRRVSAKFRFEPVDSSAAMTEAERRALLDEFARLGFQAVPPRERADDWIRIDPKSPGARHHRKLLACAFELERIGAVKSDRTGIWLQRFTKKITGIDRLQWLDPTNTNAVIEGLKGWKRKWEAKHPIEAAQLAACPAIPASAIVNAAIFDAMCAAGEPRSPKEGIANILALLAAASKDLSTGTAAQIAELIRQFGERARQSLLRWDYRKVRVEMLWLLERVREIEPTIAENMAGILKAGDAETETAGPVRGPGKKKNER